MDQKEKDLIRKIEEETKNTEVPESLKPEAVEKKLAARREEMGKEKRHRFIWKQAYTGGLAAAAFLVIVATLATRGDIRIDRGIRKNQSTEQAASSKAGQTAADEAEEQAEPSDLPESVLPTAKDYGELYACLKSYENQMNVLETSPLNGGMSSLARGREDAAVAENAAADAGAVPSDESSVSYSGTNTRQAGVDEGDTVKTDGSYLYVLKDTANEVSIVDIRKENMKEAGSIKVAEGCQISEIYVTDGKLIICYTDNSMNEGRQQSTSYAVTYDVTDPEKPKKLGEISQAGGYHSSRVADGYLYMLSDFYVNTNNVKEEQTGIYVPSVDGKTMSPKNIYLPPDKIGCRYLVVTSVSLKDPVKTVDSKGIFYQGGNIYVSNDNIYLASVKYEDGKEPETTIQKVAYQKGKLRGCAQGTVKGYLDDSFALDEYNGYLRMVVTRGGMRVMARPLDLDVDVQETDTVQTNAVYVLDKNLKEVGKIENLAKDERVYSSRFMGDTAYFVTFQQTDPLFSVDLSDPENPKITGELKLPGFSDYLHPFGKDMLLGIGMDMDEEGVTTNGVKISMYDISDPSDVKEVQKYVLEGVYGSPATYDYKAVLADAEKGIIGFSGYGEQEHYYIFSYDDEKGFTLKMEEEVNNTSYLNTRGLYAGERLYVIGSNAIESYRMKDYKKVDDLII